MISMHPVHSARDVFESFSILGMVVGTFLIPMAVIWGLFLIIKAVIT